MPSLPPTPVSNEPPEEWPPRVAGVTVWRSWASQEWFWCCPVCKAWCRHYDPQVVKKGAHSHCIKKGHYVGHNPRPPESSDRA